MSMTAAASLLPALLPPPPPHQRLLIAFCTFALTIQVDHHKLLTPIIAFHRKPGTKTTLDLNNILYIWAVIELKAD